MDCNSYDEAFLEAGRRAKHLQPGEICVVEFVRPPEYSEKVTETITVEIDIDDPDIQRAIMSRGEAAVCDAAEEMIHNLPQYYHGKIFGSEIKRAYGQARFIAPRDVTTKYRVDYHPGMFDSYDDAATFLEDKSEWTDRRYVTIEAVLIRERGPEIQMSIAPLHEKYDVEVDIKLPIENLDYIVFGG